MRQLCSLAKIYGFVFHSRCLSRMMQVYIANHGSIFQSIAEYIYAQTMQEPILTHNQTHWLSMVKMYSQEQSRRIKNQCQATQLTSFPHGKIPNHITWHMQSKYCMKMVFLVSCYDYVAFLVCSFHIIVCWSFHFAQDMSTSISDESFL